MAADEEARPARRYITREGFERFQEELRELWSVERRKVVAEVQAAAAQGDRSENAEYIYGKKRLREIDRRVEYLTKLLDTVVMVDPAERRAPGRAFFGCHVTVEDEEGARATYQLVGADESDASARRISIASPLGKALLGKNLDDTVSVQLPKGRVELTIVEIGERPPAG